jgi:hypothetical protein
MDLKKLKVVRFFAKFNKANTTISLVGAEALDSCPV